MLSVTELAKRTRSPAELPMPPPFSPAMLKLKSENEMSTLVVSISDSNGISMSSPGGTPSPIPPPFSAAKFPTTELPVMRSDPNVAATPPPLDMETLDDIADVVISAVPLIATPPPKPTAVLLAIEDPVTDRTGSVPNSPSNPIPPPSLPAVFRISDVLTMFRPANNAIPPPSNPAEFREMLEFTIVGV